MKLQDISRGLAALAVVVVATVVGSSPARGDEPVRQGEKAKPAPKVKAQPIQTVVVQTTETTQRQGWRVRPEPANAWRKPQANEAEIRTPRRGGGKAGGDK